jgi:hypothetical protein
MNAWHPQAQVACQAAFLVSARKRQAHDVVRARAGMGAHNMHGDTPARHMRQEAHYLVDLAVLLYTMGLQITYQRLSAQVPPDCCVVPTCLALHYMPMFCNVCIMFVSCFVVVGAPQYLLYLTKLKCKGRERTQIAEQRELCIMYCYAIRGMVI